MNFSIPTTDRMHHSTRALCCGAALVMTLALPALAQLAPEVRSNLALLAPWNPMETVRYTGATIHTVSGPTLEPGELIVKGGRILSVSAVSAASGAPAVTVDRVVDLKGLHLFPGIILPTSSLGLTELSAVRASVDVSEAGSYTPDVRAWTAVNPDSELIPVARANGITHALVLPMGGLVSGQSALMTLHGWTHEEMNVRSPVAMHVFWPSMGLSTTPKELARSSKSKSPEDQAKERQKRLQEFDEFFSEAHAYAQGKGAVPKSGTAPRKIPAWEAMLPVVRGEIPIIVHADDARQIKAALAWAETRKYQIIIAGGRDAWRVADSLAAKKVPVILETVFDQPARDTDAYDTQFRAASMLHRAGVKVMFSEGPGSSAANFARNVPYAAAQAVAFGLPMAEGLKGLTLYPAQSLGVADRLGSIEAGKDATFFVATGNILDLRSNVKRMWIAGREVSLESRHTRLYEKYRNRPVTK